MRVTIQEFAELASLVKAGQVGSERRLPRRRRHYDPAYLDYSKALTTQIRRKPEAEGARRALGTGVLGAILGALAARMAAEDPKIIAGGAILGALTGAIPGYRSGRSEALSENTRLNFLRRQGVTRPGELEAMTAIPGEGAEA